MVNNQDDNKDTKNNEEEAGTTYLKDDINPKKQYRYRRLKDDDRKKPFFGEILAFFRKHFYILVAVLPVIAILLIGMTYIKVTILLVDLIGTSPGQRLKI